jgi:aryl-alcohol dehydrogenase-like predicted oxidoreductase
MTRLGEHGPDVSRVGLGCMGMSGMYGPAEAAVGDRYPEAQMGQLDSER